MADGSLKTIEDIKVGDLIMSYDFNSNGKVVAPVTGLVSHTAAENNGYLIINKSLRVTANHQILINGYWQDIGKAKVGDLMQSGDGSPISISSIEKVGDKVPTYNLEVDYYHNYYAEDILVHNALGGGC
jgi:intein/homing endonuclease